MRAFSFRGVNVGRWFRWKPLLVQVTVTTRHRVYSAAYGLTDGWIFSSEQSQLGPFTFRCADKIS